jgi:hypothetical protein
LPREARTERYRPCSWNRALDRGLGAQVFVRMS